MAYGRDSGLVDMSSWIDIANIESRLAQERILSHPECRGKGSETVLCLDISGSMEGEPFSEMINTAKRFINGISSVARDTQLEDNIALVTFGHETRFVRDLCKLYKSLLNDLATVNTLQNYSIKPRIIVMSDGLATPGSIISGEDNQYVELEQRIEMELMSSIMNVLRRGAEIYCIPFGKYKKKYLQIMADRTNGEIIPPNEISRLVYMHNNYNAALNIRQFHCIQGEDWKAIAKERLGHELSYKDYDRVFGVTDKAVSGQMSRDSELYEEFDADMPPIGKRVRRGPDWTFANQDANGPGTVIGHVHEGLLWIKWDHGETNQYPFNNRDGYSVLVVDEPRKHIPGQSVMVGMLVIRGPDWRSGNDDGGLGNIGIVFRTDSEKAWVKWENGNKGSYRFGKEDCYEIEICESDLYSMTNDTSNTEREKKESLISDIEDDAAVPEDYDHRLTLDNHEAEYQLGETVPKTISQPSHNNDIEPTINGQINDIETEPKTINTVYHDWQYLDNNEWQQLPQEVSNKLEKSFNSKMMTQIICHNGRRFRVNFEKKPMVMRECNTGQATHEYQIERKEIVVRIPREVLIMEQKLIELYKTSLKNGKERIYHTRVLVVGPEGVGKTVLTKRLLKLPVDIDVRESTNGIDVHVRKCGTTIPDGKWLFDKDEVDKANRPEARIANVMKQKSQTTNKEDTETKEIVCDLPMDHDTPPNVSQVKSRDPYVSTHIPGKNDQSTSVKKTIGDHETPVKSIKDIETIQSQSLCPCRSDITEPKRVEDSNETSILRLVKETYENASFRENTALGEVSFWDFGGQIVFYSTHQTFLTPRAVYLVVIDISKALKDVVPRQCYTDKDGKKEWNYEETSGILMRYYEKLAQHFIHQELMRYLLRLSFILDKIHKDIWDKRVIPPVIIVATHVDKLTGNKMEQIRRFRCDLKRVLKKHGVLLMLDNIIEIDNTIDDPNLDTLRKEIFNVSSKQSHWGEEKPASWIMLEKKLMEQKTFEKKILSMSAIRKLNEATEYPIQSNEELLMFLSFHHAIGNVVYFNEDILRDYIILDPQWLIDAFKLIITSEELDEISIKDAAIIQKWDELNNCGILRTSFIDFVWVPDDKNCFHEHKGHIVNIMLRLDIIAKPIKIKKDDIVDLDYFFVPSMLKEKLTRDELASLTKGARSTPYLCHVFENDFLPSAVFHGLLAACMGKWRVSKKGNKSLLYCGCGIFDVTEDKNNRLLVCNQNNVIQMKVYRFGFDQSLPDVKLCVDVRKFVDEKLQSLLDRTQQQILSKSHIRCKKGSFLTVEGLLDVEELQKHPQITCHEHASISSHSVSSYQLLRCWYGDQIYDMPNIRLSDGFMEENFRFEEYDRCPTERELSRLAKKLGPNFKDLGRELGIKNAYIVNIVANNPSDVCSQGFEVLRTWTEKFPTSATLNSLETAMSKAELNTKFLYEVIESEQDDRSEIF